MKFRIKNCPECAYWNSPERLEPQEFCFLHRDKEDQPPAIIKAIKELKKERQKERIVDWIIFFVLFTFATLSFISLFGEQKKSLVIFASIALTLSTIASLSAIREIVNDEKEAQAKLKELQKKHSEWIIE